MSSLFTSNGFRTFLNGSTFRIHRKTVSFNTSRQSDPFNDCIRYSDSPIWSKINDRETFVCFGKFK